MGLFSKAQPSTSPSQTPAQVPETSGAELQTSRTGTASATVIARPARVQGELSGSGEFLIEGRLDGRLLCEGMVTVAEAGVVKGDLRGRSVTVAGTVEGNVSAEERVELTPSARLKGDITAPRMHIAEGAVFEGQVFMRKPGRGSQEPREQERPQAGEGGREGGRRQRRGSKGGA